MRRFARPLLTAGFATAVLSTIVACGSSTSAVNQRDTNAIASQLDIYQRNQPIPAGTFSQYRQTLISVENAQIHGVATTSFFFVQGSSAPYKVCPSIGFPVPSTGQLTNPQQVVSRGETGLTTLPQMEPNGTFTGDSSGTYVTCVAGDGTKYVVYAEGFVHTEGGAAHWDKASATVVVDGAPTVTMASK
ncbi:hypothetical protein ACIP5Y_21305 [Nocardia sp. NPDC088792]|uniref:hypothetical protein n=1 Tax=Nocardia sp. NPDC088792 TaxID=3364332 RepID=UPI0038296C1A